MVIIQTFLVAFFFSYIGSIPPGTINISVIQLTLNGKVREAIYFALAAALVEFFYATFAVGIQFFFVSKLDFTLHFKIVAASAMLVLGIINFFSKSRNASSSKPKILMNGFKKGVVVSIFNPLAIPFWVAVTAYLESQAWVAINKQTFWIYIAGISTGTFLLLTTLVFIVSKFKISLRDNMVVNKVTGLIFIGLGIYTFLTLL
ncbi:LysE family transporter [Fulvivirgaceae bacterium BMA12]|uniref:LysE family transporter n=1 Tax=Agaribacillus aureus TaxID=3051825 RepID=A0ABT8LCY4_9BACT|nr:LysE family transporter [Fulvivirgaceae bacterium BMA12]